MSPNPHWQRLVEALESELKLLGRLRDVADEGKAPLVRLDVPEVEAWTARQHEIMAKLATAGAKRARHQEACLPASARGIAGDGPLARTVTLHAIVAAAPPTESRRLRQQRDALRQLRDEIAVISRRNEVLIGQVLEFTQHLGEGLVESTTEHAYDAQGQSADKQRSGELFRSSI
jgi:flagellar biosynthesis/type III secretory pathway chaperone